MSGLTREEVLTAVHDVDVWLDRDVAEPYQGQPLAQDWARVGKIGEEIGEVRDELILGAIDSAYGRAVAALIALTGQNPRKGVCGTRDGLLKELGDVAVTAIFGIQHFTKDAGATWEIVSGALAKAHQRALASTQPTQDDPVTHYSPAATERALTGDIHGTLACGAYNWGFVTDDWALVNCRSCKAIFGTHDPATCRDGDHYGQCSGVTA